MESLIQCMSSEYGIRDSICLLNNVIMHNIDSRNIIEVEIYIYRNIIERIVIT